MIPSPNTSASVAVDGGIGRPGEIDDMSGAQLETADLRAMLALLGQAHDATGAAQFADVLIHNLNGLVVSDLVSYNEINLAGGATHTFYEPELVPRPELEEAFGRLVDQHPLVREYSETGNARALRMSDFLSLRQLRGLGLYDEVFNPLETNFQLAFSVAIGTDTVIGIGLNRRDVDFSDREVAMMNELQPHLASAFEHAVLRERHANHQREQSMTALRLAELTPREREVALLLAAGRSNRQIARTLFISERTAEKHVANALHKLGVASRAELAVYLAPRTPR
jgi:DNA-binding CsgD family transcriptional regulator